MGKIQVVKIARFKKLIWTAPVLVVALLAGLVQACSNLISDHQSAKSTNSPSETKQSDQTETKAKVTVDGKSVPLKENGRAEVKRDDTEVSVSEDQKTTASEGQTSQTTGPDGSINVEVKTESTNQDSRTRVNIRDRDRDQVSSDSNVRLKQRGEGNLNYEE